MNQPNPAARSRTRRFLLQALYQAQLTGDDFDAVIDPFVADHNMKRADIDYFREVLKGIQDELETIRNLITARLDRGYEELDPIEKAILLIGTYELQSRIDIPYKVVINEAVELAKSFGATESFKYVNSVLDALAIDLRQTER
ncbi:MAG: transcription antitermination factor NusB [Gammaproteobacteria bacterium]|jgi:transcription antitermination protein NusB|nr:transcription antitermination factor NusB [Gammaproteobacteria bacterium]MBT4495049.1 transcription antitermination factor NusB [Gammaproteobacteria bacterium]MBT7371341.1 transcription antitermination factor NusB [Gammaproteobacteria bacterium]